MKLLLSFLLFFPPILCNEVDTKVIIEQHGNVIEIKTTQIIKIKVKHKKPASGNAAQTESALVKPSVTSKNLR